MSKMMSATLGVDAAAPGERRQMAEGGRQEPAVGDAATPIMRAVAPCAVGEHAHDLLDSVEGQQRPRWLRGVVLAARLERSRHKTPTHGALGPTSLADKVTGSAAVTPLS